MSIEVSQAWLTQRERADGLVGRTIAAARAAWDAYGYDALTERSASGAAIEDAWRVCQVGMDPTCEGAPTGGFAATALVADHPPHARVFVPGPSPESPFSVVTPCPALYEEWTWDTGEETVSHPGTMGVGPVASPWGDARTSAKGGAEGTTHGANMHDNGSRDIAISAGDVVRFSGYFYAFNTDVRIEVRWHNAAGTILSTDQIAYNAAWPEAWTAWTNDLTAPANTTQLTLIAMTGASGGVGASGWIDQIRIYVL